MRGLYGLLALCLLLSACGAEVPSDESPVGVIFAYNGREYDLQERASEVNALLGETQAGKVLVVEGHCSPHAAYYGIFDTEAGNFVKDIIGTNLVWREDDITTAVYNCGSEIYDYEGNLLCDLKLGKNEYIGSLTWTGSRYLTVEIDSEAPTVLELEIPEAE